MRVLRFIVNGQTIVIDPNCDFDNLVPGTSRYLRAEFIFSSEWNNCAKCAGFYSNLGFDLGAEMLTDGKSCMIPTKACEKSIFKIQLFGKSYNEQGTIKTNKVVVKQKGGNK